MFALYSGELEKRESPPQISIDTDSFAFTQPKQIIPIFIIIYSRYICPLKNATSAQAKNARLQTLSHAISQETISRNAFVTSFIS